MTAKKKTSDPIPTTRYRRRDQIVDVLEGAAVLSHTGEQYPDGVTSSDGGGLLFLGELITDSSMLVYDELGTPIALYRAVDFREMYDADFDQARGPDVMKGDLAQAEVMVKKLTDQAVAQDAQIDQLRADREHMKQLIQQVATALGIKIDKFENEEAFLAAVAAKHNPTDSALLVLRDILRIEPAQNRDDGGRIIHLTKKVIDRAVAVV